MGSVTMTNRAETTHLWFAWDPAHVATWRYFVKLGRASDDIDQHAPRQEMPLRGRPPRPPKAKTVVPEDAWENGWKLSPADKYIPAPVVEMTVEQFDQLFPKDSDQRKVLEQLVAWGDIEVTGLPAGKALRVKPQPVEA